MIGALMRNTIRQNFFLWFIFTVGLGSALIGWNEVMTLGITLDIIAFIYGASAYVRVEESGNFIVMMIIPLIYSVVLAYRLLGKKIANGSITVLLQTPHARAAILSTQMFYAGVSLVMMFSPVFGWMLWMGGDKSAAMMTGLALSMNMVVLMGCFFITCVFQKKKNVSVGISIIWSCTMLIGNGLLLSMDGLPLNAFYKWMYTFGLLRNIEGAQFVLGLMYGGIACLMFGMSILIFRRRRLYFCHSYGIL